MTSTGASSIRTARCVSVGRARARPFVYESERRVLRERESERDDKTTLLCLG